MTVWPQYVVLIWLTFIFSRNMQKTTRVLKGAWWGYCLDIGMLFLTLYVLRAGGFWRPLGF